MLACKQQVFLFSRGSNRATPTHMSKISCVAAGKHEYRAFFANVRGWVLNSYIVHGFNFKNTTGELVFSRLRVDW